MYTYPEFQNVCSSWMIEVSSCQLLIHVNLLFPFRSYWATARAAYKPKIHCSNDSLRGRRFTHSHSSFYCREPKDQINYLLLHWTYVAIFLFSVTGTCARCTLQGSITQVYEGCNATLMIAQFEASLSLNYDHCLFWETLHM